MASEPGSRADPSWGRRRGKEVTRLNRRRMSRDQTLTCFTSQTTVGRGSVSRAGRTRTTASWRVVGLKISLAHHLWMSAQRGNLDGADTRAPRRCTRTRRDAVEATRWWRVHPTVGAHTGEGLKTAPRARSLSSRWVARRSTSSVACSLRRGRGSGENE
jgi:hypothetical protein